MHILHFTSKITKIIRKLSWRDSRAIFTFSVQNHKNNKKNVSTGLTQRSRRILMPVLDFTSYDKNNQKNTFTAGIKVSEVMLMQI